MKVLFLDIDGVCNSRQSASMNGGVIGIDPMLAFRVGKIQMYTDCQIVLSSSWRLWPDGVAEVEKRVAKLYGVTPDNRGTTDRGCEIIAWLEQHPEVTRHAILDDDTDFHDDQPLFRTSWETGITDEIAEAVITYLNKEN